MRAVGSLTDGTAGDRLKLSGDGLQYSLDSVDLADGEILELLTDGGWVSGHYRTQLHPETGLPAFELHLGFADAGDSSDHLSHAVIFLPPEAILRRHMASARLS